MPGSAKRYGLDVKDNLELEIRLRRIEQALEQKADANIDSTNSSRARIPVPQVTGLSLVGKTPGAATIKWNAVPIPDLKRYEVNIAEDLAFSVNAQLINVAGTEFNFSTISTTGGGGDTTFFAKVRARNLIDQIGPYSVILNTTTGQAQTSDIADEAVTIEQIDDESAGSLTTAQVQALIDASTAGLISASSVPAYIDALILSFNGGDAKSLDIASGVAADSTDTLIMSSSSAFTKDLEVAWAEGTAQGGMGDGITIAADTWYHVFMIAKTDGTVDFGTDTDVSATNLLVSATGYTLFRRIGSVKTNEADTDIREFIQTGNKFTWILPDTTKDIVTTDLSTTLVTYTVNSVPIDVQVMMTLNMSMSGTSGGNVSILMFSEGMDSTQSVSHTASPLAQLVGPGEGGDQASQGTFLTNTSAQVGAKSSSASGTITFNAYVQHYEDFRGQNGL